jgi:hypothetical protein
VVLFDLSKAFDRVWHKGLIKTLQVYWINGAILGLSSYLMNRTQNVMYRNLYSSIGNVQTGVPQGSVLGRLLFLLFVNDVANNMVDLCRLYADDNSLQQICGWLVKKCSLNEESTKGFDPRIAKSGLVLKIHDFKI